jgi:ADP-ribose pyrophosphatase YjhB (NUDIX family)
LHKKLSEYIRNKQSINFNQLASEKYYHGIPRHHVAVDCIIFGFDKGELKVLLIPRKVEPLLGQLSLMGGFVQPEESVNAAATRVLRNLTGLKNTPLEHVKIYGEINRDSGARVISAAYYALINTDKYNNALGEKYEARWININKIPALVFDHKTMIKDALTLLRKRTLTQPVGFELLPDKFTLPQLQQLYEAIHDCRIDKRNFRSQLLSYELLEKLDEKDKSTSKKGAFLYRFDKKRYKAFISEGFSFKISHPFD